MNHNTFIDRYLCVCILLIFTNSSVAEDTVDTPKFESVVLAAVQPHQNNQDVIWYDNFDNLDASHWRYLEPKPHSRQAKLSDKQALGGSGQSMECFYGKGKRGIGNRKLVFGDCPFGQPLRKGEKFQDIYWRIYVKHQKGWTGGGPSKMSRATVMVSRRWNQACILHVWGSGLPLTLDPVTGVRGAQVVTKKYNDFANFVKWLGNRPRGKFPIHATEESGRWVCVEVRMRLNTPGKKDGYGALWIDGRLDTERHNMNFRGRYTDKTINAVFLEAYWNKGSPVDQYRWYDDFVVSTKPIGPLSAEANPTLIKTPYADCAGWEAEIAADADGNEVVWKSKPVSGEESRVTATEATGAFTGKAADRTALSAGPMYFCRVRQRNAAGAWSAWSGWHQPFTVAKTRAD